LKLTKSSSNSSLITLLSVSVDILGLPSTERAKKERARNLLPKRKVDEKTEARRELKKMLSFRPATVSWFDSPQITICCGCRMIG
jgi:hypothetical protein